MITSQPDIFSTVTAPLGMDVSLSHRPTLTPRHDQYNDLTQVLNQSVW